MKKLSAVFAVAAVLAAGSAKMATAQRHSETGKVIFASYETAKYKERMPGVEMAVLWGDPDKGPHGTFTRFKPGFDAGIHTHPSDVWIVVLKGAYLYKDDDGDKRVGPGDFLRVPGGHKHHSRGDKADGAVFYQEGSGKFDLVPSK